MGFEGFAWNTHGNVLLLYYGGSPETAVDSLIHEVVGGQRVIVLSSVKGRVGALWVVKDPEKEGERYASVGETM